MVYHSKVVAAIKVGGKVLRESSDTVSLPFGSEYSILLKNLNSVRILAQVSIDGADAVGRIVIPANSEIELERFLRNGNLSSGNRFKFIERTAPIEKHRGTRTDDGLVRVEWWTEKVAAPVQDIPIVRHHYIDEWHWQYPCYHRPYWYNDVWCGTTSGTSTSQANNAQTAFTMSEAQCSNSAGQNAKVQSPLRAMAMNCSTSPNPGITVPGSESHQQFTSVSGFPTFSQSEVIVLHLQGEVGGTPIAAPITVEAKPTCSTCGRVNKATHRFCSTCGTALTLL